MSQLLRGVALVDAVMKQRREKGEELTPCDADVLAARRLGDLPLTPALRRWFEHDDDFFVLGEPMSFGRLLLTEMADWAEAFEVEAALLTAPCLLFEGWGSDSRRFLYLGRTDSAGEYPVFTIDVDDTPYTCINGPVDMWLAQQAGFLEAEREYGHVPPAYAAARDEQARLNFAGIIDFDCGNPWRRVEVPGVSGAGAGPGRWGVNPFTGEKTWIPAKE